MILGTVLVFVFAVTTFALWREGLWATLITLVNVLLAASLATAWHEWAAAALQSLLPTYSFLLDFVALWAIFCGVLFLAREVTDRVSPSRVRFRKPVELFGTPLAALIVAWTLTAFTATTLHAAPVPPGMVSGESGPGLFLGTAPDRAWLAWVRGATSRPPFGRPETAFDPAGDFIARHAARRAGLEKQQELRVAAP
jgi:hypothetical protein